MTNMTDVWKLETPSQDYASIHLNQIIEKALTFTGTGERHYLKHLWNGESWQHIKEKALTEGSVWYVWYMDGVNHHLAHLQDIEHEGFH